MAPYAGRVRRGLMEWDQQVVELPIVMEPHAIHGTTYGVAWDVVKATESSAHLRVEFGPDWPFGGWIEHHIELFDGFLRQTLTAVSPDVLAPVTFGWHPWFPRHLRPGGAQVHWSFDTTGVRMFQRDADGIATSMMVDIPEGRVDDCFSGVATVRVEWPGEFAFDIEHDCPVVVLFDGLDHAVCVEPQTGPPDVVQVWPGRCEVSPGVPVSATCIWRWDMGVRHMSA